MKKQEAATNLEQLWEKGIERATVEQPHKSLEQEASHVAVLPVRSGTKAGEGGCAPIRTSRTQCPTLQC